MSGFDWHAAEPRLRVLWHQGLSASAIGQQMGLSKNAVVGKAHRLELPARPSPIRRGYQPRPAAAMPPPPPLAALVPLATMPPAAATPAAAAEKFSADGCQWPSGDRLQKTLRFCQALPLVRGRPYCAAHLALAVLHAGQQGAAGGRGGE